jgi:hypothetical protein
MAASAGPRDWASYDALVAALRRLGDDETLLVQSGRPVGAPDRRPPRPRWLGRREGAAPRRALQRGRPRMAALADPLPGRRGGGGRARRVRGRGGASSRARLYYDRLARGSLPDAPTVRVKTYCYALRPALALAWMRRHGAPPPMDVPGLVAGLDLPAAFCDALDRLVARADALFRKLV